MNIVFVSEQGFIGKVDDNFTNLRTEYMWMKMLGATHLPYNEVRSDSLYYSVIELADLVIFIPSKKYPQLLDAVFPLKGKTKLAVMQEGAATFWQDWDMNDQMRYLAVIRTQIDIMFVHNEYDVLFYKGFTSVPVIVLPSVHDTELAKQWIIPPTEKDDSVMIGGNMCRWYNGMGSFFTIVPFGFERITIPSMGRKKPDEEEIMKEVRPNINYLPYLDWSAFMKELTKNRYAIHLMPEVAAGSFSLNCAMLGIPCIGNKYDDTQRICFPDLCVDPNNVVHAQKLMNLLRTNPKFYQEVRDKALENVKRLDYRYQQPLILAQIDEVLKMSNITNTVYTSDGRPAGTPEVNDMEHQFSKSRYTFMKGDFPEYFKGKVVYDPGCGWGAGARYLMELGAKEVIAVDFNPEAIELANKSYSVPGITYKVGNIVEDVYPEGTFDVIAAVEIVEHVTGDEFDTMLDSWRKSLKMGGHLYITTPEMRDTKTHYPRGSHWTEYEFEELKDLVEKKGYKLVWHKRKWETRDTGMALIFERVV